MTTPTTVANEYHRPTAELESILADLYAATDLSDVLREVRANVARTYHDRTGVYYAARYHVHN